MLLMTIDELNDFLSTAFNTDRGYFVDALDEECLIARVPAESVQIRPGGTVSGPTMMALADGAAYCQVLAHIGPVALAVTSSLNMTFLRKPEPAGIEAQARFMKLGRKLAVVDVQIRSEGRPELVAQAVVTYAIPSGGAAAS
jgi:uncharacterized protein (TIGR00369 family)